MKTATYTSTISRDLLEWLQREMKQQGRTRRDIIEEALHLYKREQMRAGFKRAANDPDIIEWAELGVEDYARTLKEI